MFVDQIKVGFVPYSQLLLWMMRKEQKTSLIAGHKSVLTTQIYVNMEKMAFGECSSDYMFKVASTVEEACKLIEVGFEYVTEIESKKLFRKRK
jgi:hypothetical protein